MSGNVTSPHQAASAPIQVPRARKMSFTGQSRMYAMAVDVYLAAQSLSPTSDAQSSAASRHLLRELHRVQQEFNCEKVIRRLNVLNMTQEGFSVETVQDNLFVWHVKLFNFDENTQIFNDLLLYTAETGRDHVLLEILFPPAYPNSPPFVRVVYPRFHQVYENCSGMCSD